MKTIVITSDNFMMNYPESISVKRNADGTYNLYALMRSSYNENGKDIIALTGVKSEKLKWKRDFGMQISLSEDRTDRDVIGGGRKLFSFPMFLQREILYNLQFSKTTDTLVEFEILNKGEGIMDYNVFEGLENYTVQVNVAGFSKEELDVIMEDGIIRVKTKPASKLAIADDDCVTQNFEKAKAECEIYLPNVESVEAELKNGILYLNIPKVSKGEKIDIKIA